MIFELYYSFGFTIYGHTFPSSNSNLTLIESKKVQIFIKDYNLIHFNTEKKLHFRKKDILIFANIDID